MRRGKIGNAPTSSPDKERRIPPPLQRRWLPALDFCVLIDTHLIAYAMNLHRCNLPTYELKDVSYQTYSSLSL
jgi:hypothetical protein